MALSSRLTLAHLQPVENMLGPAPSLGGPRPRMACAGRAGENGVAGGKRVAAQRVAPLRGRRVDPRAGQQTRLVAQHAAPCVPAVAPTTFRYPGAVQAPSAQERDRDLLRTH